MQPIFSSASVATVLHFKPAKSASAQKIIFRFFSGVKSVGDNHAPLIYAQDPRHDVPDELQAQLLNSVAGCDDVIVSGWLEDSHGLS